MKDGARSVARTVRNNFLDGSKQEAIDMLLTGNAFAGKLGARCRELLSRQDVHGEVYDMLSVFVEPERMTFCSYQCSMLTVVVFQLLNPCFVCLFGKVCVCVLCSLSICNFFSSSSSSLFFFFFCGLASPVMIAELCDRHKEFVEAAGIRVSVGTWNVNGGRHFRSIAYKNQSMHDWLLDARRLDSRPLTTDNPVFTAPSRPTRRNAPQTPDAIVEDDLPPTLDDGHPVDIFAIGFEELVDLSATNIVSTRLVLLSCLSIFLHRKLHPWVLNLT